MNELSSVADALEGVPSLTAPSAGGGVEQVPLTRIGTDPASEWCAQAEGLDVEAVVIAGKPEGDDVVERLLATCRRRVIVVGRAAADLAPFTSVDLVDVTGPHAAATFDLGVRLAVENDLPLRVDGAAQSGSRRSVAWVRRARSAGVRVLAEDDGMPPAVNRALVVGSVATDLAAVPSAATCLLVRAGSSEPVDLVDVTLDSLAQRTSSPPHVRSRSHSPH